MLIPPHLREYLPLKQGLRPALSGSMHDASILREYLPLKQGLRLCCLCHFVCYVLFAQRVSSIKTRIKTYKLFKSSESGFPQRVSSIKTRIKTSLIILVLFLHRSTQRVSSIKTRIKTQQKISEKGCNASSESIFH